MVKICFISENERTLEVLTVWREEWGCPNQAVSKSHHSLSNTPDQALPTCGKMGKIRIKTVSAWPRFLSHIQDNFYYETVYPLSIFCQCFLRETAHMFLTQNYLQPRLDFQFSNHCKSFHYKNNLWRKAFSLKQLFFFLRYEALLLKLEKSCIFQICNKYLICLGFLNYSLSFWKKLIDTPDVLKELFCRSVLLIFFPLSLYQHLKTINKTLMDEKNRFLNIMFSFLFFKPPFYTVISWLALKVLPA